MNPAFIQPYLGDTASRRVAVFGFRLARNPRPGKPALPESRHTLPTHAALRVPRRGLGFSLVELALVTVIVGIVAAMAVPRYADALSRYQIDAAAQRVVADLAHAREHARASSASTRVWMRTFDNHIQILELPDPEGNRSNYTTELGEEPYSATLTAAQFDGDQILIFDGYGRPDSGGLIILRSGGLVRTITVDATTGEATIQ